jgi:hypothetical protein
LASHEKRYIYELSGQKNLSTEISVETNERKRHFLVWAREAVSLSDADIVIVTNYLKD